MRQTPLDAALAIDRREDRVSGEAGRRVTSTDPDGRNGPALDGPAGARSLALARLIAELDGLWLDGHGSGPAPPGQATGAMRRLEARVAAAVLGAAAFERPRARARSADLFRVDPIEAGVADLVLPGESAGMVGVRPVLRSFDAAVQLARDGGVETAWALRLSLPEAGEQTDIGGPAAPVIATRLCRILVLLRLVEELAGAAADPWLAPFERDVLTALAASPRPVATGEVGQLLDVAAAGRGRKVTVTVALWRLHHLGLACRRSGAWRCTGLGYRLAGRPDGARRCSSERERSYGR